MRAKNDYRIDFFMGEEVVMLTPNNQNNEVKIEVVVPKKAFFEKLYKASWGINWEKSNKLKVKYIQGRIDGSVKSIHKVIFEHNFSSEYYHNKKIYHLNGNPLDNRLSNLKAFPSNMDNLNKKIKIKHISNSIYQINTTLANTIYAKTFTSFNEAEKYQEELELIRQNEINKILKLDRYIEFKRGLNNMIENNEVDLILNVLKEKKII